MVLARNIVMLICLVIAFQPQIRAETVPAGSEDMVFSIIASNPAQIRASEILKKAYGNLGISAEFINLPGRRALEYSNSGKVDGEVFRIKTINEKYQNLVRVRAPIMSFQGVAYATKPLHINRWQDLKPYRVGILRGIVWSERGTNGLKVARFDSNETLLDKLLSGGVDVIVTTYFSLDLEIQRRDLKIKIYGGQPLVTFDVYHFLHQKHIGLREKVDGEIRKLVEGAPVDAKKRQLTKSN